MYLRCTFQLITVQSLTKANLLKRLHLSHCKSFVTSCSINLLAENKVTNISTGDRFCWAKQILRTYAIQCQGDWGSRKKRLKRNCIGGTKIYALKKRLCYWRFRWYSECSRGLPLNCTVHRQAIQPWVKSKAKNLEVPCASINESRRSYITVDLFKDGGDIIFRKLSDLMYYWARETIHDIVTEEWKPIFQTLRSTTKVISSREIKTLDFNQPREKAGFRKSILYDELLSCDQWEDEKSANHNKPIINQSGQSLFRTGKCLHRFFLVWWNHWWRDVAKSTRSCQYFI